MFGKSTGAGRSGKASEAVEVCNAVANGDFESRVLDINPNDGMAELWYAINNLIDHADAYVRESSAAMEFVGNKKFFRRILLDGMPGAYLNASKLINNSIDAMGEVNKRSVELGHTVSGLVETVTDSSQEIAEAATSSGGSIDETSGKTLEVSESARRSRENVQAVAAAVEELSATSTEIARQVTESSNAVGDALKETEAASASIQTLSEAAGKIGSVVDLITDIAGQTNLLALNATIEAARAGEAGKGFAVVASEVKNLATQTAKATESIVEQVNDIRNTTQHAVSNVNRVKELNGNIHQMGGSISASVEEQSAATAEIADQTRMLLNESESVEKSVVEVVQASAFSYSASIRVIWAAGDLNGPTQQLKGEMSDFLSIVT